MRAEAAGAGADFENPQPATLGERVGRFLHSSADSCQPVACQQTVPIKMVEQFRSSAGEQYLHGILLTAQNRTEFGAISSHELRFGKMTGMLRDELSLRFVC